MTGEGKKIVVSQDRIPSSSELEDAFNSMLRRKQNYQRGEWIIPRLLTREI